MGHVDHRAGGIKGECLGMLVEIGIRRDRAKDILNVNSVFQRLEIDAHNLSLLPNVGYQDADPGLAGLPLRRLILRRDCNLNSGERVFKEDLAR